MELLIVYVSVALGISFLCSLLEAALLSTRQTDLAHQAEAGGSGAKRLLALKSHRLDDAISAILSLNTISNTAGAALAGNQARVVLRSMVETPAEVETGVAVFAGIMTFLVLFLAEIPPKTLGAVHASRLVPIVGWLLHYLTTFMAPLLVLTRALTRLLSRKKGADVSRTEVAAFLSIAAQEGAIEGDEGAIFSNLLRFKDVRVEDVMTPRTVCVMLPTDTPAGDLLKHREAAFYSRIPLFRDDRDEIVGYVMQRDVMRNLARGGDHSNPLSDFKRKVWFIPEKATLNDALRQFAERRQHLALVTDEHGGVSGLVTFEDLIETILGVEIVDESDRHTDMRDVAIAMRDQRLARYRETAPDLDPADFEHPDEPRDPAAESPEARGPGSPASTSQPSDAPDPSLTETSPADDDGT